MMTQDDYDDTTAQLHILSWQLCNIGQKQKMAPLNQ